MPTRLPYGLSYVLPGANSGTYTLTLGSQTPSVALGTYFVTAPSALTLINFSGGERGKIIFIRCDSAGAVTVQNSAGGINIGNIVSSVSSGYMLFSASGGNAVMLNREVMEFAHNGTDWDYVGTRSVINTQV